MTLGNLFERTEKGNIAIIVENHNLQDVEVDMFYKKFGVMTRKEMIDFILNPKNAFELSKFGHNFEVDIKVDPDATFNADGYRYGTPSDRYESNNQHFYKHSIDCA